MIIEISCLVGGVPLGFFLRTSKLFVTATSYALIWSVRVLLFLLGLVIGSDDNLMSSLGTIGLRGVIITLFCLVGTLIGARLIDPVVNLPSLKGGAASVTSTEVDSAPNTKLI